MCSCAVACCVQGASASAKASRERARLAVLEEADVVCSTLSFAGSGLFERLSRPFDVVVIDEAAQAVEPSTLIPLVLGCQQVWHSPASLGVRNVCFTH